MLLIDHPSYVRFSADYLAKRHQVEFHLTYRDRAVHFELEKHKKSSWFIQQHGEEKWKERLAELEAALDPCLLFEDERGLYTYSGLAYQLAERFQDEVRFAVSYPEPHPLPWKSKPVQPPRYFQLEMNEALLDHRHAAVQVGTGLGKSRAILEMVRNLGLKTIIMAPLSGIAEQLFRDFKHALGERYVGYYGGGKKKFNKLITIAVAQSLTRIEEDSPDWDELSKVQVFIADESHQTPAESLRKVCFGLCAKAPYRFFFSGTQTRGDGAELLLKGIIGPIVYTKTVREGVNEGFLAKPVFKIVEVTSDSPFDDRDANAMTRAHLFYNAKVCKIAATLANKAVSLLGHQVLILVDEVEQFSKILPYLQHEVKFAHGGLVASNPGFKFVAKAGSDITDAQAAILSDAFIQLKGQGVNLNRDDQILLAAEAEDSPLRKFFPWHATHEERAAKLERLFNSIEKVKTKKVKGNKEKVPAEFHDSDPLALVEAFNSRAFPILIGTSCIATGLDVRAVQTMLYLRGGKSEVEIKQGVGRGTRLVEGKTSCTIIDFDVVNVEKVHEHALVRAQWFDEIYGPVQHLNMRSFR